jgi:single-strand DNA-binding protein
MSEQITVTGLVATDPKHTTTTEGVDVVSFRLASTRRKLDRESGKWVDADTNWFTVVAFRDLAANAAASVSKGQRIIAVGNLRIREWTTDERHGTNVEIEASALGHDLSWGTSEYTRTPRKSQDDGEGRED